MKYPSESPRSAEKMGRTLERSGQTQCVCVLVLTGVLVCCRASEITMVLVRNDTEVDCVVNWDEEYSKYCLAIRDKGQPLSGRAFRCFFNEELVYKCSSNRACKAQGTLEEKVAPDVANKGCSGLPFSDFHAGLQGTYRCELDNSPTAASLHVAFCTESSQTPTEVQPEEEKKEDTTVHYKYIYMTYGGLIVLFFVGLVIFMRNSQVQCTVRERHTLAEDNTSEVKSHLAADRDENDS
ncbi:uncharacterized protein [Procambarus clarkii]|uniref:uncharacterized protein isoform X2 n=1 Tax=Procambarus clarkii TaxID=6728 RepID=UPI003741FED9